MRTKTDETLIAAPDNTAQVALTFDDNRLASSLFGQYGQNLALIERRLGVVATSRGNQVTLEGPREACEQARRVLETLYERLARGDEVAQGDVDGAVRLALSQGLAVRFRSRRRAGKLRRDQSAQAPGARPHPGAGRVCARAQAPCAGFLHRPGRHRQDLACGRSCRAIVRAQGSRSHRAVAAGGRSRRAARLFARRHAREGRSLSAADLRRALRPDGRPHC